MSKLLSGTASHFKLDCGQVHQRLRRQVAKAISMHINTVFRCRERFAINRAEEEGPESSHDRRRIRQLLIAPHWCEQNPAFAEEHMGHLMDDDCRQSLGVGFKAAIEVDVPPPASPLDSSGVRSVNIGKSHSCIGARQSEALRGKTNHMLRICQAVIDRRWWHLDWIAANNIRAQRANCKPDVILQLRVRSIEIIPAIQSLTKLTGSSVLSAFDGLFPLGLRRPISKSINGSNYHSSHKPVQYFRKGAHTISPVSSIMRITLN